MMGSNQILIKMGDQTARKVHDGTRGGRGHSSRDSKLVKNGSTFYYP